MLVEPRRPGQKESAAVRDPEFAVNRLSFEVVLRRPRDLLLHLLRKVNVVPAVPFERVNQRLGIEPLAAEMVDTSRTRNGGALLRRVQKLGQIALVDQNEERLSAVEQPLGANCLPVVGKLDRTDREVARSATERGRLELRDRHAEGRPDDLSISEGSQQAHKPDLRREGDLDIGRMGCAKLGEPRLDAGGKLRLVQTWRQFSEDADRAFRRAGERGRDHASEDSRAAIGSVRFGRRVNPLVESPLRSPRRVASKWRPDSSPGRGRQSPPRSAPRRRPSSASARGRQHPGASHR